jgi:hypothetical protein
VVGAAVVLPWFVTRGKKERKKKKTYLTGTAAEGLVGCVGDMAIPCDVDAVRLGGLPVWM